MGKPDAASAGLGIKVMAYSGYKANERPVYFLLDHNRIDVKKILDRWTGPEHDYFKVLGDDGKEYLLQWHRSTDQWFLAESAKES
jgi:hypothetical protein